MRAVLNAAAQAQHAARLSYAFFQLPAIDFSQWFGCKDPKSVALQRDSPSPRAQQTTSIHGAASWMDGRAPNRRRVQELAPRPQTSSEDDLVWAKLAPELPWWPARLAAPGAAAAGGPTVAIEVLGAPGRAEILRVQRRRIDHDFRGRLAQRAAPWKRRKCSGIKRAFGEALTHARQLLAGGHARCALCGVWQPVPGSAVPAGWSCPGGCKPATTATAAAAATELQGTGRRGAAAAAAGGGRQAAGGASAAD